MAKQPAKSQGGRDDGPRVNQQIQAEKVRLIIDDGEMLGVLPIDEALQKAEELGLDLVEVSPTADPPVCKAMDYGKYRYEQQKKAAQARKNQKVIEVKEIKIRPNIDEHDYQVKMRSMHRFLDDGNKVKITVRFRGREMAHNELGFGLLKRIKEEAGEKAKVEYAPKMEGRQMIMILAPEG